MKRLKQLEKVMGPIAILAAIGIFANMIFWRNDFVLCVCAVLLCIAYVITVAENKQRW